MGKKLSRCADCKKYGINDGFNICVHCKGKLESVNPPKFSPEEKYQDYRLPYFKEKMIKRFNLE